MDNIPLDHVADDECLHRRISPDFIKPDGKVSSQAFTNEEMSVDRGQYLSVRESLLNLEGFGLVGFYAEFARGLNQEVVSDPLATNIAHALVKGKKTRGIKRQLARESAWVVRIGTTFN